MIDNQYTIKKVLGKGGSSQVFLAEDADMGQYAVKAIRKDKNFMKSACCQMLEREYTLLQKMLHHPNIINSYGINFEGTLIHNNRSETIMYVVLEYAKNGSIAEFIRQHGPLSEELAKVLILQLCHAIEFIHTEGYGHLDIKPENILLDQFFNIKLADMGSCVDVAGAQGSTTKRRGTSMYMAPEVFHLEKDQKFNAFSADVYSLGITLFILLTGEVPSIDEINCSVSTEVTDIKEDTNYDMDKSNWHKLSVKARKLIISMTTKDPQMRPNISEVICNEWLSQEITPELLQSVYTEMDQHKTYFNN